MATMVASGVKVDAGKQLGGRTQSYEHRIIVDEVRNRSAKLRRISNWGNMSIDVQRLKGLAPYAAPTLTSRKVLASAGR